MKLMTALILVPIVTLALTCGAQEISADKDSGLVAKEIREIIDPLAASNNYSGRVVVRKGFKTIFQNSYGLADRENGLKTTPKTRFFLASVSAMFTSAATMRLVDAGKLSLDDRVSKFLPEFRNGGKMTIHHLLTERTGIPRIGYDGRVNYETLTESAQTIDELIGYFKDYELSFEPGSDYEHSRSSYILLAKIIEIVSGKPFGQFLREEVFEPLGMKDSGHFEYADKYSQIPNLARGYVQSGLSDLAPAQQIHWSSKTGHASIYSTADDLTRFADAALRKKLLSAEAWEKILTPHDGVGVGYGWFVGTERNRRRFYMSGGSPGFSSLIAVYPDQEVSIVMLSNIQIFVPYFTVPKLAAAVFGEPYEKLKLVVPPNVDEKYVRKYVGTYRFENGFYNPRGIVVITGEGSRLFADGGPLIPIDDGSGSVTRFIHRRYWSTLEFVRGSEGEADILKFDNFTGKKVTDDQTER